MTDKEMQSKINEEIEQWRKSEDNEPLAFDFEDGDKIVIVKEKNFFLARKSA
jgi:hypothetical protein